MKPVEDIYIFSSYSLSEIHMNIDIHIINYLIMCGGLIVWNAIKHDFTEYIKSNFEINIFL